MNAEMKVLQKKQNADFKILNLTDPQLVDPDWREDKAIRRELYDTVTYENGEEKRVWAELYPGQFTWYGDRIRELEALGAKESSIIKKVDGIQDDMLRDEASAFFGEQSFYPVDESSSV